MLLILMCVCFIYQQHLSRHGDIVYVTYVEPQEPQQQQVVNGTGSVDINPTNVKQDQVDDFLGKQRGLIDRKKDPKL